MWLITVTKFCCSSRDFNKNSPCQTKWIFAATCRLKYLRNIELQEQLVSQFFHWQSMANFPQKKLHWKMLHSFIIVWKNRKRNLTLNLCKLEVLFLPLPAHTSITEKLWPPQVPSLLMIETLKAMPCTWIHYYFGVCGVVKPHFSFSWFSLIDYCSNSFCVGKEIKLEIEDDKGTIYFTFSHFVP